MQAPERRDDQPAERTRADHHGGVTAAGPAQYGMERGGRRFSKNAALVGDAVCRDQHVLVNEEALAPAPAGALTRSHRPAGTEGPAAVGVLAEVRIAGPAPTALAPVPCGRSGASAPRERDHPRAPTGRGCPLDNPHDLVPGDERAGGRVGREDVRHRVAVHECQVGATDAGKRRADQYPARSGGTGVLTSRTSTGSEEPWLRATPPPAAPASGAGVHESRIDD